MNLLGPRATDIGLFAAGTVLLVTSLVWFPYSKLVAMGCFAAFLLLGLRHILRRPSA